MYVLSFYNKLEGTFIKCHIVEMYYTSSNLSKLPTKFTAKYLSSHFMSTNNQSDTKHYPCHPMSMINQNIIL